MPRRALALTALLILFVTSGSAQLRVAPVGERPDPVALDLLLRKLASTGSFMQTDAHPDDEDNGLLAMLGDGQGMRTTLVTLTRGDGGQNEIGPELGQSLGVLRTEELLAVHRFDGAEQYFTRAIDFGFSFSVEESIEKWGHDEIVGDIVRHIRTIRPDVIVGFLCGGQAGGLHHQASAQLTREAFRAAGDPKKYPEQIKEGLTPWQAVRYFCTDETSFAPQPPPRTPDMCVADVSGFDAVLGRTYAELGLEARSMHKCQGTSQLLLLPGQSQNRTYKLQDYVDVTTGLNLGAPHPQPPLRAGPTMFDGIDTTLAGLARFTGGRHLAALTTALEAIQQSVADAAQASRSRGMAAAVTPLASGLRQTRALRAAVPGMLTSLKPLTGAGIALGGIANDPDAARAAYEIDFRLAQKERQFQDALVIASGIRLDALADDGVVTPGQNVNVSVYAASGITDPPQLRGVTLSGFDGQLAPCAGSLAKAVTCKTSTKIPASTHLSTPYWTPRKDAARYDFEPDVPFGVPFRPTPFRATFELTIGGEMVTVERPVQYRYSNLVAGEKRSQLNVSPAFDVTVDPDIAIFPVSADLPPNRLRQGYGGPPERPAEAEGGSYQIAKSLPPEGGSHEIVGGSDTSTPVASAFRRKTINVTIANNQKGAVEATATIQAPAGWRVDPASQPVKFNREDEEVTVKFTLQPPQSATLGEFAVKAVVAGGSGAASDLGYQVVEYPHIHRRHVVQEAVTRVKVMDVTIVPGLKVGYIMGVGDRVPEAIEQLGADVKMIDAETLASGDLSQFDVIVLGVRAYERRQDLRANNQRLLQYAENGGTVIVQYQRTEFNDAQYGPFPAKTTADRVTDENAPIEILTPNHPVFNTPNKIGPDVWSGWVQERGTYFLGQRDPRYVDLVRAQDPFPYNAGPKTGMLVEARVGKGRWFYTGLGLWRQLPAGTDGAYRLLANLLSLGKR
jgi:LmbE family N-acetylglucosaminyl deacetylase